MLKFVIWSTHNLQTDCHFLVKFSTSCILRFPDNLRLMSNCACSLVSKWLPSTKIFDKKGSKLFCAAEFPVHEGCVRSFQGLEQSLIKIGGRSHCSWILSAKNRGLCLEMTCSFHCQSWRGTLASDKLREKIEHEGLEGNYRLSPTGRRLKTWSDWSSIFTALISFRG